MGFSSMAAMANPPKPISVSKILREALALPTKNVRLILPILLIYILSSFLLFLGYYLTIRPLRVDLSLKSASLKNYEPNSPEISILFAAIVKDFKQLYADEVIFLIVSFFINSLQQISVIHALTTTYSGELLTLKEFLSKLKRGIKGPMITQFYAALLNLGLGFLLVLLALALAPLLMFKEPIALVISDLFLLFLALVFSTYLATVLSLSAVVSVADEGCYGVDAIGHAMKLIKGKKRQAISITVLCYVLVPAIYVVVYIMLVASSLVSTATVVPEFVQVAFLKACTFFALSAFTVLYYECREIHGDQETIAMAGNYAYNSVSTTDAHVDKELP